MFEADRDGEVPVYRQIADAIRADIEVGRLKARRPLPSEIHLQQRFGVARDTVRRAIAHLAELGLVRTVPGRGTFVRARGLTVLPLEPGLRVIARPATDAEVILLEVKPGGWVLVVERADGSVEVLPAEGAELRVPVDEGHTQ